MKKIICAVFCGLVLAVTPARGQVAAGKGGDAALEKAVKELSARIVEKPAGVAAIFDRSFFNYVSIDQLTGILASVYKADGRVVSWRAEGGGHYILETDRGYEIPAALAVDSVSGRIKSLFFKTAYKKDVTLKDTKAALAALPGRTGLLAARLGEGGGPIESLNPDQYFAVASAFKLYVLGALLEEGVSWKKIIALKEEDKSLPTGRLQDWPDGSPLTAHTLAAMMISESDNTAADTLISALGRKTIESDLAALGHSNPALLKPFLRTSEMFKLKTDSGASLKYLSLDAAGKYDFLAALPAGLPAVEDLKQSPFGVDSIEWRASPADLCRVLGRILKEDDRKALDILAMNRGLKIPDGFLYAGYKGGSEPGVLAMTWLLKTPKSGWLCLAAAWNNEKEKVEEARFFEIMQGALNALGKAE